MMVTRLRTRVAALALVALAAPLAAAQSITVPESGSAPSAAPAPATQSPPAPDAPRGQGPAATPAVPVPAPPATPAIGQVPPAAKAPAAPVTQPLPQTPSVQIERYTLQVSDVVNLAYRYTPEFDFTGPIQPDGYITVPLLGAVPIAGLTVEEARARLLERAQMRLRDPELSFVLKDFQRPFFTVGGEVEKPGQFELRGRVGVLEAVAMAGGFKRSAKHSQVVLLRRFDNDRASARLIDAKRLSKGPDPEHDLRLEPGDMLLVPQNRISKIERFVPLGSLLLLNPFIWR